jgi:ketosteroid isomerase-like protein
MTSSRAENKSQDAAEIERLHNVWANANRNGSIPMMREAFVGGDKFFGWNLNGYAYEGIEEWAKLWRFLGASKAQATLGRDENLRIQIRGDVGWLTCTNDFTITLGGGAPLPGSGKFRSTEIYVREDESGKPVWKMWHCHFSQCAPDDKPRMGFED